MHGAVVFELTAAPSDGIVPRLIRTVDAAHGQVGRCEHRADRLSALFVLSVMLAATAGFTWHTVHGGLDRGILVRPFGVAHCLPAFNGGGNSLGCTDSSVRAAAEHILLRESGSLERLASIKAICFGKTGALTSGNPRLLEYIVADVGRESEILSVAAALAKTSPHVYSLAIADFASHIAAPATTEARCIAGRGVIARLEGCAGWACLGSPRIVEEAGLVMNETIRAAYRKSIDEGLPTVFAGWNGQIQALFVFAETLQPGVHSLLRGLKSIGRTCTVLTGEQWQWAKSLKSEPGVSVVTGLSPEEKPRCIRTYHDRFGPVAMVGDGVNDAPARSRRYWYRARLRCRCLLSFGRRLLDGQRSRCLPWLFALADATSRRFVTTCFGSVATTLSALDWR